MPTEPDEHRSAAWWRDNEPAYDGRDDAFLAWLNHGKPATDEQKRFFAYRNAGYDGWLDQGSRPTDDTEQAWLNASFGRQRPGDPGIDAGSGLDSPPAAEPYTPAKRTPHATGSTGGAEMSNIEGARGSIMRAHQDAQTANAQLANARDSLEDAQNGLRYGTEGSNQAEADQAHGLLAEAMSKIEEARAQVAAALQEFEGVAQRL